MKLLFLAIDGLRPDCLLFSNSPTIKNLISKSIYSFDSYIDTIPVSGPSWSCILSGRTENVTKIHNNRTVENKNFKWKCKNLFSVLNSMNIKCTSLVSSWVGMKNLVQDCEDTLFIKRKSIKMSDKIVIDETIKQINNSKENEFLFLYLNSVDDVGHKNGFSLKSKKYINHIEYIDSLLNPLITKCIKHNWNIFITTDHGGVDYELTAPGTSIHNQQKKKYLPKRTGTHSTNIRQNKRVFQLYYGKIFRKVFNSNNKEILEKISSKDIYKNIINSFN